MEWKETFFKATIFRNSVTIRSGGGEKVWREQTGSHTHLKANILAFLVTVQPQHDVVTASALHLSQSRHWQASLWHSPLGTGDGAGYWASGWRTKPGLSKKLSEVRLSQHPEKILVQNYHPVRSKTYHYNVSHPSACGVVHVRGCVGAEAWQRPEEVGCPALPFCLPLTDPVDTWLVSRPQGSSCLCPPQHSPRCGDPNWGPHACAASALTHWASL